MYNIEERISQIWQLICKYNKLSIKFQSIVIITYLIINNIEIQCFNDL